MLRRNSVNFYTKALHNSVIFCASFSARDSFLFVCLFVLLDESKFMFPKILNAICKNKFHSDHSINVLALCMLLAQYEMTLVSGFS